MWSSSPPSTSFFPPSTSFPTDPLLLPYLFDTLALDQHQNNAKNDTYCSNSSTASRTSRCESPDSSASSSSTSLYSLKVFLGGLPRGTTKVHVMLNFQKFGAVNVEMQDAHGGYCFVIFKSQTCCQKFMKECTAGDGDRFYYPFSCDVFSSRKAIIEVKPFKLVDAHYGMCTNSMEATSDRTIFVGGVPRDTTAETLAMNLEAKFGGVSDITIDLDSTTMYPRGTAMVIFKEKTSARKAVATQVLVMKQGKKYRLIELKPFLEFDKPCSLCEAVGPSVFCSQCNMVMGNCCWNAQHVNAMNHKKVGRGTFYTIRSC